MDRYAFFRQLGKAVYQIDGAYDVFSKSARIKPNMLWLRTSKHYEKFREPTPASG